MAKKVYWSAFVDRAYGDAYRPHSSIDLGKLVKTMIETYRTMNLGDDVIVLSKSRIYNRGSFGDFWKSKAGSFGEFIGYIEMENNKPTYYNCDGKKTHLAFRGRFIV